MSRLIDADKLRSDIIKNMSFLKSAEENLEIMGGCIDDATTVDAQPIRHGRWIETKRDFDVECKCSVCSFKDFVPEYDKSYWLDRNYCPNCGAKMDGGGLSGNEND